MNDRMLELRSGRQLIEGDCHALLQIMPKVKAIIMDPPDNIGLGYDQFNDKMPKVVYYKWLRDLLTMSMRKAEIVWLSYNPIHDLEISNILLALLDYHLAWTYRRIIWRFTFGQYNDKDWGHGYRNIIMLRSPSCLFYPDAVREESERMRLGDVRSSGPRVPDDVWDFPRVTGNSKERQPWHPTQHPIILYNRILSYSLPSYSVPFALGSHLSGSSEPERTKVVDLFAGSGTIFRTSYSDVTGVEISKNYCAKLRELYKLE